MIWEQAPSSSSHVSMINEIGAIWCFVNKHYVDDEPSPRISVYFCLEDKTHSQWQKNTVLHTNDTF